MKASRHIVNTFEFINKRLTPEERLCYFLSLFLIAGIVFACILTYLSALGLFQQWTIVAQVPENTKEVVAGSPVRVFVQNSESIILGCHLYDQDLCWIPVVSIDMDPSVIQPCNESHMAFSLLSRAPKHLTSCIQISSHSGWGYELVYGVDKDGNLWQWGLVREGDGASLLVFMLIVGGFGGILLGSIAWIVRKIATNKHRTPGRPLFSIYQIILLVIPWLCLLILFMHRFSVIR